MIPENSSSPVPKTPPAAAGDGFDPDYFPDPKKNPTKRKSAKARKKMPHGPERRPEKEENKLFTLRTIKQVNGQPATKLTMSNRVYADEHGNIHRQDQFMSSAKNLLEDETVALGIRAGSYAAGGVGAAYYAGKGDFEKASMAIGGSIALSEKFVNGAPTMINDLKKATGGRTTLDEPKFSFRKTSAKTFVSEYMDRNPEWVCLVNELLNAVKHPPISEKNTQTVEHTIFQTSIVLTFRLDASNTKALEVRAEATERGKEKTKYRFTLGLEDDHTNLKELLTEEKRIHVPARATMPDGKASEDTRSPELIKEAQAILTEPTSNYEKLKKASDAPNDISFELMSAVFDTMEQCMSKTEVKDMVHRVLGQHAAEHPTDIKFLLLFSLRVFGYLNPSFKKELRECLDSKETTVLDSQKIIIEHTYKYFTENLTDASLKKDCGYYPDNDSWRPWHLDVEKFISNYKLYSCNPSYIFKESEYVLESQCLFLIYSLNLGFDPHAITCGNSTAVEFLYLRGSHRSIKLMQRLFNVPKPKEGLKTLDGKEFKKRYDREEGVIYMEPPNKNCSIM